MRPADRRICARVKVVNVYGIPKNSGIIGVPLTAASGSVTTGTDFPAVPVNQRIRALRLPSERLQKYIEPEATGKASASVKRDPAALL